MADEKCAIDRLHDHDSGFVRAEVANQKVEGIPREWARVDLLVLQESIMVHNHADGQLARVQDGKGMSLCWVGP